MKKNKDRVIRVSNLPSRETVYKVYLGIHRTIFALLGAVVVVMLFKVRLVYGIIGMLIFLVYIIKQRRTLLLEVCKDSFIKYLDNDFAEIIYYDEIENYQIHHKDHKYVIAFLLTDGDEYEYVYFDQNVSHHLQELIGDKNAKK